jgi:hypothetical protein
LAKENTALKEDMARFHKLQTANASFIKETREALERLQQVVFEWRKAQKDIDNDFKKGPLSMVWRRGASGLGLEGRNNPLYLAVS